MTPAGHTLVYYPLDGQHGSAPYTELEGEDGPIITWAYGMVRAVPEARAISMISPAGGFHRAVPLADWPAETILPKTATRASYQPPGDGADAVEVVVLDIPTRRAIRLATAAAAEQAKADAKAAKVAAKATSAPADHPPTPPSPAT